MRDQTLEHLNVALEELTTARDAGDTETLAAATVRVASLREELAAIDARQANITAAPAVEAEAHTTIGRDAAAVIAGAPIGTTAKLDRALLADPFGEVEGAQDVTFAQNLGYVAAVTAPVRFIDILPRAQATSDVVTYIKETGFENAAAARLAGSNAAESELTFTKVSEPVANVAHRIRVAEETLADAPALSQLIDRRGVSGVRTAINTSLLAATDTTNGVKSIVAASTEASYTGSLIDAIAGAKADLEALGFAPNAVVVSPAQYEAIVTAKAETSGNYLGGGPFGSANATIWGLTMVVDGALAAGVDALVCDTAAATLYVRDEANVASDRDIVSNMVTVRVQTRAQVSVDQPEGFVALVAGS